MTQVTTKAVRRIKFLLTCLLRGMTHPSVGCYLVLEFLLTCLLRGMTVYLHGIAFKFRFLLTCLLRGMTMELQAPVQVKMLRFYSHASCEA